MNFVEFKITKLVIPDVLLITPKIFVDSRGMFIETYKFSEFSKFGIKTTFVQQNCSVSKKNVLRGLHYQIKPKAQGKLVMCTKGKIFDVVVDLRKGSPWYGKYVSQELSEENKNILWIPEGFAHGFLSLEDDTEVIYLTTQEYDQTLERGIVWNDPELNILWPIVDPPILSDKDKNLPLFKEAEHNF